MNEPDRHRPQFHERRTYRRRRVMDAARFLPVFGLMLWFVPLLWPTEGDSRISGSTALIYVFAVWFLLILAALVLSVGLRQSPEDSPEHPR